MNSLDCRNQQCPAPVVATRKAILSAPGESLCILVSDDTARDNVSRLASSQGYGVTVSESEEGYSLTLTPGESPQQQVASDVIQGKTVLFVGSDQMGQGDPELGTVLMRNFLMTLNEATTRPDVILFVNSGVKLVVEGADTIEALNNLVCDGVDIAACGLCLEFYGVKDKLMVGRVSNMLETVETLQAAGRIIRP